MIGLSACVGQRLFEETLEAGEDIQVLPFSVEGKWVRFSYDMIILKLLASPVELKCFVLQTRASLSLPPP